MHCGCDCHSIWSQTASPCQFQGQEGWNDCDQIDDNPQQGTSECWDHVLMNCDVRCLWVDQVSKPSSQRAPSKVRPILYLVSYCCHMSSDVLSEIKLCIEVHHIPGGCTSYCWPADFKTLTWQCCWVRRK